jgi:hypothetical protein
MMVEKNNVVTSNSTRYSSLCALLFFSTYRHVILPKDLAKTLPKSRLLTEAEWRGIGVQQSRGWQHYAIHRYVFSNAKGIFYIARLV